MEVASVVDGARLVDVGGHEVVKPRLGTRGQRRRCVGRLGLQALDGVDVGLLLRGREITPETCRVSARTSNGGLVKVWLGQVKHSPFPADAKLAQRARAAALDAPLGLCLLKSRGDLQVGRLGQTFQFLERLNRIRRHFGRGIKRHDGGGLKGHKGEK
jgi:hypothetical protein